MIEIEIICLSMICLFTIIGMIVGLTLGLVSVERKINKLLELFEDDK